MSCHELPIEDLVAATDGELEAARAARVREHVAACASCAAEHELLARTGALVAAMPRCAPSAEFAADVVAAAGTETTARPRRRLLRLWPAAAAAAAALVVAAVGNGMLADHGDDVLSAADEREIAADLLVLTNLDALSEVDPEELILLVDDLDVLDSLEPDVTGAFAGDGRDGG